jgi:sugar lactone lactonase YvrE
MIGSAAEPAFLNDLTLLRDGTAFVTDSVRHQVVRLAPGTNAFETWAAEFRSPNGIVVSADERTLFVADFRGVNQLDLETKSRKLLETSTPLNGIDGLAEHRGALIGIHNVLGRPRVVRIHPSESNRVELLESKNPLLNVPATGVVAGDEFFFLANLGQKNADGHVLKIAL